MNDLLTPAEVGTMWQESLYDFAEQVLWECPSDCLRVGTMVLISGFRPGWLSFKLEDSNE